MGPSAVAISSGEQIVLPKSYKMVDYPVPRALQLDEIPQRVEDFVSAANNAIEAGKQAAEFLFLALDLFCNSS